MIEAFTIGQNRRYTGSADFFRLIATVGSCDIRFSIAGRIIAERLAVEAGFAEQFKIAPFDEVSITSNAVQNIQFETALGSEIRYDRGASSVTGTVGITGAIDLSASTLAAMEQTNIRPEAQTGFYSANTALAANTPDVIFLPAANTNGAILLSADSSYWDGSVNGIEVFITKASAPASMVDGSILLASKQTATSGSNATTATLSKEQYINAGQGLYYISNRALAGGLQGAIRACRFKLL